MLTFVVVMLGKDTQVRVRFGQVVVGAQQTRGNSKSRTVQVILRAREFRRVRSGEPLRLAISTPRFVGNERLTREAARVIRHC